MNEIPFTFFLFIYYWGQYLAKSRFNYAMKQKTNHATHASTQIKNKKLKNKKHLGDCVEYEMKETESNIEFKDKIRTFIVRSHMMKGLDCSVSTDQFACHLKRLPDVCVFFVFCLCVCINM